MTTDQSGLLRDMVREVLRDVLPALVEESTMTRLQSGPSASVASPVVTHGREPVVLRTDADLDAFVLRIVQLAQNPVSRQHLTSGRQRFSLAQASVVGTQTASTSTSAATSQRRIERGVVSERTVREAAAAGHSLITARGVVLTPLARDRARALGVEITKES
ncbi:MAG: hypothetical protein WCP26_02325 [Actinomycetes bacterium]